jgi:putative tryptophan/tyrosine transport system substrate-binding protein
MTVTNVRHVVAAFGLIMLPLAAHAQPSDRSPRIGYLGGSPAPTWDALQEGLRQLGWTEGKNVQIERRWSQPQEALAAPQAEELVRRRVDLIVASASVYAEAARRATSTTPIVFCSHGDPVGSGHVASLAQPGRNLTGTATLLSELSVKSLELLKQTIPRARRIAVLWSPEAPASRSAMTAVEAAAKGAGIDLILAPAAGVDAFESTFAMAARERADALLGLVSPVFYLNRIRLAELALEHRLPSLFMWRENVEAGTLLAYGPDLQDLFRRCATYVDKILKGAKPADLPVEQASTYELIVNMKTARTLGITIPPEILARADKVIE